mgnify:CR=1 FL=1
MFLFTTIAALPAGTFGFIFLGVVALLILILFIRNIRVVPQATAFVIERLALTVSPGRPVFTPRCPLSTALKGVFR